MSESPRSNSIDLSRRRLAVIFVHAPGFDPRVDRIVEGAVVMRRRSPPIGPAITSSSPASPPCRSPPRATTLPTSPTFEVSAAGLVCFLGASDLAGFGIRRLAVSMLEAEFRLAGCFFDWSRRSAVGHDLRHDLPVNAMAEAKASSQILDAPLKK